MIIFIFSFLLGCSTRVGVASTAAVDNVQIIKGPMPMENGPSYGAVIATGKGHAETRTSYVLGRRFWGVVETPEGERSVVKLGSQAKAGPIVGCVLGTAAAGLFGAWGCLYVSGPSTSTQVQSPLSED